MISFSSVMDFSACVIVDGWLRMMELKGSPRSLTDAKPIYQRYLRRLKDLMQSDFIQMALRRERDTTEQQNGSRCAEEHRHQRGISTVQLLWCESLGSGVFCLKGNRTEAHFICKSLVITTLLSPGEEHNLQVVFIRLTSSQRTETHFSYTLF